MSNLRNTVRLSSALVLLAYVVCHLLNHAALLLSVDAAEHALPYLTDLWSGAYGNALLLSAAILHYGNALWSIYVHRSLQLPSWKVWQLTLGLTIPFLLVFHAAGTVLAEDMAGISPSYSYLLLGHWVLAPWKAGFQIALLLTVWTHACIGIHFWQKSKEHYARLKPYLQAVAFILPSIAVSGYVAGGMQTRISAQQPGYAAEVLKAARVPPGLNDRIDGWVATITLCHCLLIASPFAGRSLRRWRHRRAGHPILTHVNGRRIPVVPGATVLETLHMAGIAHAAICGGRGRCTTCRVLVTKGAGDLPPSGPDEAKALERISATLDCRLACQIRPVADLSVMPLLPPDVDAAAGRMRGALVGKETLVTVVFVDIRSFTTLGETRLPYDILFILNQFFIEMTEALDLTHGHYSQFTGDGLMALYGHRSDRASSAAIDALHGVAEMLKRLDALNRRIAGELQSPLQIGIGVHFGEAIVGSMGPPHSQIVSAIGDTVNTTARLEGLTKEYGCKLILSKRAAQAAGLDMGQIPLHTIAVKGKAEQVEFYALDQVPDI